jgi:hypothetical protein
MPTISPLPSPHKTNHERLYILRGGARRSNPTAAYDTKGRHPHLAYDEADRVGELFGWICKNLTDDEKADLFDRLGSSPAPQAADEEAEASLDPNATRAGVNWTLQRKRQLNAGGSAMDSKRRRQIAQDAHFASVLTAAFARPGSRTYDSRERIKLAHDAKTMSSLAERFPDVAKIVVHAEEVDRNAGPHSMANDGRLVRSLEERYPDLKKIGFAS